MTTKTKIEPRWPDGDIEWQAAADAAELMLTLDAAQQFGLIDKRLPINVGRCAAMLQQAELRGIVPRPGPATNAGLLAIVKSPAPAERLTNLPKPGGNPSVRISVKAQRIAMPMDDACGVVQFRTPVENARYAEVKINRQSLEVRLFEADRCYSINLPELIYEVAVGDGSYG